MNISLISQILAQAADAGGAVVEVSSPVVVIQPPSMIAGIVSMLATPTGITMILGAIAATLTALKMLDAQRKKLIAIVVGHAFYIVEDIANESKKAGKTINKLQEGLKIANEYMLANGWRELKPTELAAVKLELQSIHGATLKNP